VLDQLAGIAIIAWCLLRPVCPVKRSCRFFPPWYWRLAEAYQLIGELTEPNERLARRARDVSGRAPPMGLPWELAQRMDGGEMWYRIAADLVVAVHLLFISFVVGGAFLAWRWPRIIWAHLPAMVYGALIEFTGFTCPLTPLENYLRHRAGDAGYRGGFIAHYLVAVIYPPGLTRGMQLGLGVMVLLIATAGYWGYLRGHARGRESASRRPAAHPG
jgi:hypothetical protein